MAYGSGAYWAPGGGGYEDNKSSKGSGRSATDKFFADQKAANVIADYQSSDRSGHEGKGQSSETK
jgi:hypothetical protein